MRKLRDRLVGVAVSPIMIGVLLVALVAPVRPESPAAPALNISAIPARIAYAPGDTVIIGVRMEIPRRFHLYGNPLGPGVGKPLQMYVTGAEGITWIDILKVPPVKFKPAIGEWVWAYEKQATFFLRGIAETPGEVKGAIGVDALICSSSCYPLHHDVEFAVRIDPGATSESFFAKDRSLLAAFGEARETMAIGRSPSAAAPLPPDSTLTSFLSMPVSGQEGMVPHWNYAPREGGERFHLLVAILLGFFAGIILNAMPCVLPVLGIKILSLAHGANRKHKNGIAHSAAFSAGVLSIFMLFAGLASFVNYSWGQQFQDPRALAGIITLIVVFALGMFDVYTFGIPSSLSGISQKPRSGLPGDFLRGALATILATPCSGPLLGAVLAWSVTQSPLAIFVVYGSIGAGMASPYVLLATNRRLTRLIPKPGRWMEDLKKIMGFFLLGFAAYLLLGLPMPRVVPVVLFCIIAAFGIVTYVRFAPMGASISRKSIVAVAACVMVVAGGYLSFITLMPSMSPEAPGCDTGETIGVWRNFSADLLLQANAEGRTAMVDFTATWCLNCQYNYITVLTRPEVIDLIKRKNILAMKADLTMANAIQDSLLHRLGSRSIPFLAIFPGERPNEPIIMRDILKKSSLVKILKGLPDAGDKK